MIGTITEALNYESFTNVVPSYLETTMKGNLSDAPDDSKVLSMMPYLTECGLQLFSVTATGLNNLIDNFDSGTIASVVAEVRESMEKTLADNLEKFAALNPNQ